MTIVFFISEYQTEIKLTLEDITKQYKKVHAETTNLVYSKEALENRFEDKNKETGCWRTVLNAYKVSPSFLSESQSWLHEVIGPWYYNLSGKNNLPSMNLNTSLPEKFLYALARADLLKGYKTDQNLDEALLILNEIIRDDPTNTAPVLYAALVEKISGKNKEVEKYLSLLKSKNRFDSYMKVVAKSLFNEVKTPSDLLAIQEVWSQAPLPDYVILKNFIIKNNLTQIAHQLTYDGLQKKISITDLSWIPLEYATGKEALDKLEKNNTLDSYDEFLKKKKSLIDAQMVHLELQKTCDLNSLEDDVKNLQNFLKSERDN